MNASSTKRSNAKAQVRDGNVAIREDWTDESLLERFKRDRDENSYQVLYTRHWKRLRDAANTVLKDVGRAEDVAQEVLVKLWKRRILFKSTRNPRRLLLKMAHDLAVDVARKAVWMEPNGLSNPP